MNTCQQCGAAVDADAFFCTQCGAACCTLPGVALTPVRVPPRSTQTLHPLVDATALAVTSATVHLQPSLQVKPSSALPSVAIPHNPPSPPHVHPFRRVGVPCIGFGFTLIFLFGLTEFIGVGGVPGYGLWPAGVLIGGELLAQESWVRGNGWAIIGMIFWCGLTWLAAAGRVYGWF